ncbi:MAG: alkaline phosphatase family protein, partial [Planctomycetota bacterium]
MRAGAAGRRWWVAGIAALAVVYLGLSFRNVPTRGQIVVLDSPFLKWSPRVLPVGWHIVPAGLLKAYRYPEGRVELSLTLDAPHGQRLKTRDGSAVGVELEISYRLQPERVLEMHKLLGYDFERSWLSPRITEAVRDEVGRSEFEEIAGANRYRLERSLAGALSSVLDRAGLTLDGVAVWRVVPGDLPAPLARVELQADSGTRVLFIGIDSADWSLMDPLMERGDLPNFSRLVEGGVRAKLRTIAPTLSPVIWTTVATGKLPEKHGIVDFLAVDSRTGQQVPVTSNLRRAKAIWNILSETGAAVGVIAWWATWPPETVEGYMVSDRLAYQLFGMGDTGKLDRPDAVYPQELFQEVESLRVRPEEITVAEMERFLDLPEDGLASLDDDARARVEEFRAILAATRTYDGVAHYLFRRRPAPFQAIY